MENEIWQPRVNNLFVILAFFTPVLSIILALVLKKRIRSSFQKLWLLIIAIAGPANLGLWKICYWIDEIYGLDSVKGLTVKVFIFVALGLFLGLCFVWARRKDVVSGKYAKQRPDTQ